MQSKVAPFAATPDPTYGRPPPQAASDAAAKAETTDLVDEADLRLMIEEDQATGEFVYTTINRRTGEVVQQLPREDVLKLRDSVAYLAGKLIRTKA